MELVLIGLCGCTGYDVVSILRKKREAFTSLEVSAKAERAADPPQVYTDIKLTYRVGGKVSRRRSRTLSASQKKSIVRSQPCSRRPRKSPPRSNIWTPRAGD